ncbi:tellurite resistance TerB family protein [Fodinicurvata halophila]|uniref:Tellurite resistance TerB family protein n=1 Tax=Fodinicurvata halophila TaxID=1419723 RepID=A0ABV8UI12_9PROT
MLDHHSALIYAMVLASAADQDMNDEEVEIMSDIIKMLPAFKDYDLNQLSSTARACAEMLRDEEGLELAVEKIRESLSDPLRETAYALACDVVAADGFATQEELRLLELLRHRLDVPRLEAAAIERGAAARFRQV